MGLQISVHSKVVKIFVSLLMTEGETETQTHRKHPLFHWQLGRAPRNRGHRVTHTIRISQSIQPGQDKRENLASL